MTIVLRMTLFNGGVRQEKKERLKSLVRNASMHSLAGRDEGNPANARLQVGRGVFHQPLSGKEREIL